MQIDRVPEPKFFSSVFDSDFIQMPNIAILNMAGTDLSASQGAGDLWLEHSDPAKGCLIGNADTALEQHFLDVTQAQIEPQLKPDRM